MNSLLKVAYLFVVCTTPILGLEPGKLIWNAEPDVSTYSAPSIGADGIIYVGLNFGGWTKDGKLYSFYSDGSIKWIFDAAGEIEKAPSVDSDGTIYFGTASGRTSIDDGVFALNPDGTLKWSYITDTNVESPISIGYDGTVYFIFESKLYALNPDGTLKWQYNIGSCAYSAAAVFGPDSTIYLGNENGELHAINTDGIQKWIFKRGGDVGGPAAVGSDGIIYIGYKGRYTYSSEHCLYAVNPDGTEKWNFKPEEMEFLSSAPSIGPDNTIYISDDGYNLYAINPNGEQKWLFNPTYHYMRRTPAIGSDGRIYIGCSMNGYFHAVNPDGSEEWMLKLGDGDFTNCAIGKNGTIYAVNEDYGFCAISSEAYGLANSEWPKYMGGNLSRGRPDDPPPPNDIGTASVEMDSIAQLNNAHNVKVKLINLGSEIQSNFQLGYQVDGAAPVVENYTNLLSPNSVSEYIFETPWIPNELGYYELTVFTNLVDDQNTTNDTLRKTIEVVYQNDIGISQIDVPSAAGINKSVTIKVELTNNGTENQNNFPISYRIDSGNWITENYSGTLASKQMDVHGFSETWTPTSLGSYLISVKTDLSGDQNTANDTLQKNVTVVNAAYMGTWEGTTSQNKPLSFMVNGNDEVTSVSVELRVDMGSIYCTTTFKSSETVPIVNDTFKVSLYMETISANPDFVGRFTSIEKCTGEIPEFTCAGGFCGDTFVIGTGVTNSAKTWSADRTSYVGVDDQLTELNGHPDDFKLFQNFPNPFNPKTTIEYQLPKRSYILLKVFDIQGREVLTLVDSEQPQGNYQVKFDSYNLPSGTYFYQLETDEQVKNKRMLILK